MFGSQVSTILYVSRFWNRIIVRQITKATNQEKQMIYLLFKKIGIVVAPLHFEVCAVLDSDILFSSDLFVDGVELLLVMVDAFPPLRIRRRFAPTGPGKFILPFSTRGFPNMFAYNIYAYKN